MIVGVLEGTPASRVGLRRCPREGEDIEDIGTAMGDKDNDTPGG